MEDPRQELIDNFEKYHIRLDDTFAFKCRSCGKCCKNREDIILNPRDIFNIATALNLTHEKVIKNYCEAYIGGNSRIPIVRLLPKGVNKVCPLLVGDRCSIQSFKPTVCALFPVGRVIVADSAPKELNLGLPITVQYILNPVSCGSLKRKQTIRAWLERFSIPVKDEFYMQWNKIIIGLASTIQAYEEMDGSTEKTLSMIWDAIFVALYVDYTTCKDFAPQFDSNTTKILNIINELQNLVLER